VTERTAVVLTVSDSVAAGSAEDRSGPAAADLLATLGFRVESVRVVPDGIASVSTALTQLASTVDLVVTTGGTGLGPRDLTPEATRDVIDREVPGLSEAMRSATFGVVPHGMLSRGIAGLIGSCLVVNLPGSVKAVTEGLDVIGAALPHAVDVATGIQGRHD
jgi:molybdenum cofactor synthesis domain-containing protein